MVLPTPGFSEAPMTAIDLGEKKIELDMGQKPLRVVINASSRITFLPAAAIMLVMSDGLWVVLIIPAIIAFVFGAWVFYNMVLDVSDRNMEYRGLNNCVEGCQVTP
jgi:hypothetical protein